MSDIDQCNLFFNLFTFVIGLDNCLVLLWASVDAHAVSNSAVLLLNVVMLLQNKVSKGEFRLVVGHAN